MLASALDATLYAHGFTRKGLTWNRTSNVGVDIIDLQEIKSRDQVFVNLAVADRSIFALLWERDLPDLVQEPDGTVRTRLGPLFSDLDVTWDPTDPRSIGDIAQRVESHGLPFLDRMHQPHQMADFLRERRGLLPVELLTVALVFNRAGDSLGACEILGRLAGKGPWHDRVERLRGLVGCGR